MAIRVEVLKVDIESKGKYTVANVAYKGPDGKVDAKKLMSFVNKEVYAVFKDAQPGDVFEVVSEKIDGYWNWTSAVVGGKNTGQSAPAKGTTTPRSNFETPDERASRQVYIVKQSSISNAVALLTNDPKAKPSVEDVIGIAQEFVDFVFSNDVRPNNPGSGLEEPDVT